MGQLPEEHISLGAISPSETHREGLEMSYGKIIHRVFDDSYVITKNGMPYHVYPYAAEFAE